MLSSFLESICELILGKDKSLNNGDYYCDIGKGFKALTGWCDEFYQLKFEDFRFKVSILKSF